jgi:MerR family transcriptional regulator/heat shock protein HspR
MQTPTDQPYSDGLRHALDRLLQREAGDNEPVYVISIAADLVGVHAQTLRHYERVGLIEPARSEGNIRLFSRCDVRRMRAVALLTGDLGVNLAGVEVILDLRRQVADLRAEVDELQADLRAIRGYLLEDHLRGAADRKRKRRALLTPSRQGD